MDSQKLQCRYDLDRHPNVDFLKRTPKSLLCRNLEVSAIWGVPGGPDCETAELVSGTGFCFFSSLVAFAASVASSIFFDLATRS